MKALVLVPAVLVFASGCIGAAPKAPKKWSVEWSRLVFDRSDLAELPPVKLMSVDVRAPYGGTNMPVLRADGSIAFDSFNAFAAPPASLLKGAAFDALESSCAFERVVSGASAVRTPLSIEVYVKKLALDCRKEEHRDATVALTLVLTSNMSVVASSSAEATVPVTDGNFASAFSSAFSEAMLSAVGRLEAR